MHIPVNRDEEIQDVVNTIWVKFDKDKSGQLNRRETLRFLNEFLSNQGRPPTTNIQFNHFF
jgi:hypothetical protein